MYNLITHHLEMCMWFYWNLKWPPQIDFLNICDRKKSNPIYGGGWYVKICFTAPRHCKVFVFIYRYSCRNVSCDSKRMKWSSFQIMYRRLEKILQLWTLWGGSPGPIEFAHIQIGVFKNVPDNEIGWGA